MSKKKVVKRKRKYHQGFYKVKNTNKYIGNPEKCIFRSKWEYHFMVYCDNTDSIIRWSSEHKETIIPYQDETGKYHRYFPDFYIERIDKKDPMRFDKIVIEIKPYKETQQPIFPKKETAKSLKSFEYQLKTFQKNLFKWSRAKDWCDKHMMQFIIMTEHHLKRNNIM